MHCKPIPSGAALLLAALVTLPAMAQDAPPGQTARSFEKTITRTVRAGYLLFRPRGYDQDPTKRWPLLLFLHGAGERGRDLELVKKHGPPRIVAEKPDFPFVVVSPQCPTGQRWDNDTLLALLDQVLAEQRIDRSRVYLTGLSMGGYGTWSLGLQHPERFAALVPICGGGDPVTVLLGDPAKAAALRTLPVWAFHGAKDNVVPLQESEKMVGALRKAGVQAVELTVYPEAGHDSWTETYDNPKLYDWLLRHTRP